MFEDEFKERFNHHLIKNTDFIQAKDRLSENELRMFVNDQVTAYANEIRFQVDMDLRAELVRKLVSDIMSWGPIKPLMEDDTITEIMINGPATIYVQRFGKIEKTDYRFDSNQELMHTIQKILTGSGSNKRVDESMPYVDFSTDDGSRFNVIIPPLTLKGPVVTIRKFKDDIGTPEDLLAVNEFDEKMMLLLNKAMEGKLNVVFCGSTGSGKTTALNAFSKNIPEHERIITIEDTPELILKQDHVVSLVTKDANVEGKGRITARDLFVNSLRMRPDRIIVGEVRGGELLDLIESITSGHSGALAIVHAETVEDCYSRMVTMMLMTGIRLSNDEIKKQVAQAIDLIIHIELFMDGVRRVTSIADVYYDAETEKPMLRHIFRWKETGVGPNGEVLGTWEMDNRKPSFYYKFEKRQVKFPEGYFNLEEK